MIKPGSVALLIILSIHPAKVTLNMPILLELLWRAHHRRTQGRLGLVVVLGVWYALPLPVLTVTILRRITWRVRYC